MDIQKLADERVSAVAEARTALEAAEAESRDMSADEQTKFDAANAAVDSLDTRIKQILDSEERASQADAIAERIERLGGSLKPADKPEPDAELRSFLRGEKGKSIELKAERAWSTDEFRVLSKLSAGAGANAVKTSFYDQLVAHLIEVSGILMASPTVLRTATGEVMQVPKTTSHSTAALVAEAGTIGASDPAFGQVNLNAYKYGHLIQVSNELVNDVSVDLMGYLAMESGRALGNAFGVHAITGTGTAQPSGIVTGASSGVTGGTAVSGAFTADNLIDLYFSVIAPYRNSQSCAWLMKDATLASVRKLKDTTNQYLWQPSLVAGTPDTLLGKPVYTDPNVAAVALSAKSVLFGDISRYFVRLTDSIRFERSDDFAFSSDLVTFRALIRADGALIDTTGAVKYFVGGAS